MAYIINRIDDIFKPKPVGSASPVQRVPFEFTSTKRLLLSGNSAVASRAISRASEKDAKTLMKELDNVGKAQLLTDRSGGTETIDPPATKPVDTSKLPRDKSILPVIKMAVNPNSVKWSQNKRYVKRDTMNGSTFFHFSDTFGRNNDILVMQFSGNTGNIKTKFVDIDAKEIGEALGSTKADLKLKIWHELYNLSREELILKDLNNIRNEFFITYQTVLFPNPITLIGFFNQVLDFTENAANPYSRDYTFSFTVTDTSPSLDEISHGLSSTLVT